MNNEQEIIIIAAMAKNKVIGKDNFMPWSFKQDIENFVNTTAHFRDRTKGWPCIMGRKTWESLPKKPLPGRLNIILSRTMTKDNETENVKVFSSLPAAVEHCSDYEKIFICGGEAVYREAFPIANKIDLTVINRQYEGDAFFPEIDPARWKLTGTVNFDIFSVLSYKTL